MAQLKDLIVTGASRFVGDAIANKIQITSLHALTSPMGTSYGPGSPTQALFSDGVSPYWGDISMINYYHTTGSWGGTNSLTYTATANGGAGELKFTLPTASTSAYGVTKLSSATNSTSTDLAATASAVKAAYDLAASKTANTGTVTSITINTSSPLTGGSSTASTTTGSWTIGFSNQNANTVLAGPSGGDAASPSFRALVADDIPTLSSTKISNRDKYFSLVDDGTWVNITPASIAQDANNFTTEGNYYFTTNFVGSLLNGRGISHLPSALNNFTPQSGILKVIKNGDTIFQLLFSIQTIMGVENDTNQPIVFIRHRQNNTWSSWVELTNQSIMSYSSEDIAHDYPDFSNEETPNELYFGTGTDSDYQQFLADMLVSLGMGYNNENPPDPITVQTFINQLYKYTVTNIAQINDLALFYDLEGGAFPQHSIVEDPEDDYQVATKHYVDNAISDTKVTQNATITTNGDYPLLLGYNTGTAAVTNTVNKTNTLTYNPSTRKLKVPFVICNDGAGFSDINSQSGLAVNEQVPEGTRTKLYYDGTDYYSRVDLNESFATLEIAGNQDADNPGSYICAYTNKAKIGLQDNSGSSIEIGSTLKINDGTNNNNGLGTSGQALLTDGTKAYWGTISAGGGGTVTQITAGAGLTTTTNGTTDGGNITGSGTLNLTACSTAATKGPTANVTGTNNTTIKVPKITIDKYGRVTALTEYTYTSKDTTYTLSGLSGVGTVSASGTAPLTLSASKSGTTVTLTGSVADASESASGVVNTTGQHFKGRKGFNYFELYAKDDSGSASRYNEIFLKNAAGTKVCEIFYDAGDATNISSGRLGIAAESPNSTANTSSTGFHETYRLPPVTSGLASNITYDILTCKGRGTLIPNSSDLNTYNKGNNKLGVYHIANGTNAGTVTNTPTSASGYTLWSLEGYDSTRGHQIAWGASATPFIRLETGTAGSWGDWQKLVGITATGSSVGSASKPVYVTSSGLVTACDTSLTDYVKKSGDTMSGNLVVSKTGDTYVEAKNTDTGCRVELASNAAGKHGLWSSGYYASSTYTASSKWIYYRGTDGEAHSDVKIYGAVYNDYAEYREVKENNQSGRCVVETGNGDLVLSTERLQRGCEIISDTFGFAIGQSEKSNTPIATTGRVLAYLLEDKEYARNYIGWPVCSGPNGTVSIMTEEEEEKYPSRIIGTISEIPDYEEWGSDNVKVDGRIWIRVR